MHTHRSTEGSHRLTQAFFLSLLFSSPDIFWCTDHPLSESSAGQPPLHFDLEGSYEGQSSYHTLLINLTLLFSSRLFSFSSFFLRGLFPTMCLCTLIQTNISLKNILFLFFIIVIVKRQMPCVLLLLCFHVCICVRRMHIISLPARKSGVTHCVCLCFCVCAAPGSSASLCVCVCVCVYAGFFFLQARVSGARK